MGNLTVLPALEGSACAVGFCPKSRSLGPTSRGCVALCARMLSGGASCRWGQILPPLVMSQLSDLFPLPVWPGFRLVAQLRHWRTYWMWSGCLQTYARRPPGSCFICYPNVTREIGAFESTMMAQTFCLGVKCVRESLIVSGKGGNSGHNNAGASRWPDPACHIIYFLSVQTP